MPQTISQAQAELLATDFLNSLGSNPEFNDIELTQSTVALIKLAALLVQTATNNLQQSGHVSSGKLSDSFKVLDPQYIDRNIQVDVEALYYYQFLNKGVMGTKGGNGQFSFKNSFASKAMVADIAQWMKRAGLSVRNVSRAYGKHEAKNQAISQLSSAYAVARSIKMKGIKATGFFDKAIQTVKITSRSEFVKAFRVDIINSIPKNLDEMGGEAK